MDQDYSTIIDICGKKPEGIELIDPGNDPSFIFTPDPNFSTIALFDIDGNTVNMNSWVECAHYVKGGWLDSVSAFINYEKYTFFFLVAITMAYLIGRRFMKKQIKNEY